MHKPFLIKPHRPVDPPLLGLAAHKDRGIQVPYGGPLARTGGAGPAELTITYRAHARDDVDKPNWSFSSVSLGPESADRHILVGISYGDDGSTSQQVSSCTINGVSATELYDYQGTSAPNYAKTEFWIAKVPTGTSVTIAPTTSGAENRLAIVVWSITGADSIAVHDTNGSASVDGDVSVAIHRRGAIALVLYQVDGGGTPTLSEITTDINSTWPAEAPGGYAGGSQNNTEHLGSYTVGVEHAGAASAVATALISLKPA